MELTAKQKRFVQEYLVDLNATAAASRAGYKNANVGRRLVSKSNAVKEAIAEEQQKRAERNELSQDYVLKRLVIEAENYEEGSSHAARVSALNLLGKHLGMFTDKVQMEHSGGLDLRAEVRAAILERQK